MSWLVGWLVAWLVGRLVSWLVGSLVNRLVVWLVCWLLGLLVCWLVGWLVGWLLGGSAGCHPRKTQGLPRQNNRNFIQRFLQPGTYFPRLITSPLGLGATLRLRRVGRRGGRAGRGLSIGPRRKSVLRYRGIHVLLGLSWHSPGFLSLVR